METGHSNIEAVIRKGRLGVTLGTILRHRQVQTTVTADPVTSAPTFLQTVHELDHWLIKSFVVDQVVHSSVIKVMRSCLSDSHFYLLSDVFVPQRFALLYIK